MHVVLPGLRQGAVDLNRGAGAADRRLAGRRLGQCRGVPARGRRCRRVVEPRCRRVGQTAGALQRDVVVGQGVLDSLERADRLAELLPCFRMLDGAGQRGARDTDQVGGRGDQRRRQRRFQVHRRDGDRLGVDLDVGDRLRGIGALGVVHGDAVADAHDGGDRPVRPTRPT